MSPYDALPTFSMPARAGFLASRCHYQTWFSHQVSYFEDIFVVLIVGLQNAVFLYLVSPWMPAGSVCEGAVPYVSDLTENIDITWAKFLRSLGIAPFLTAISGKRVQSVQGLWERRPRGLGLFPGRG
jgi:hypothetical protein